MCDFTINFITEGVNINSETCAETALNYLEITLQLCWMFIKSSTGVCCMQMKLHYVVTVQSRLGSLTCTCRLGAFCKIWYSDRGFYIKNWVHFEQTIVKTNLGEIGCIFIENGILMDG